MSKVIGIVGGKGKMGSYFDRFFVRNGYEVLISDKNTSLTNTQLAQKADVLIISVPMGKTESIIKQVIPHMKKGALLMDLTSLKVAPMEAMKTYKGDYLGCHPLFGPTADPEGQMVILCSGKGKASFSWLKKLLEKNKMAVRQMTAKKHDTLMAYIQALAHFSDIALADTLRRSGLPIGAFADHGSPVYRLELDMMGRILNQDPNLYAHIQIGNPMSAKVMRDFIGSCEQLLSTVVKKDTEANEHFFTQCAAYLGDFRRVAMEESDRLITHMALDSSAARLSALPKKVTSDRMADIAVLGPRDTYSDMALQQYRPKATALYAESIVNVFELLDKGRVKEILVPVENSSSGSVRETLDELYGREVWISKMIALPVHLALVGNKGATLKTIQTLYSHAQPFLQSHSFIRKNCPNTSCIPVESTVAALERVRRDGGVRVAAIASAFAAKRMGLTVICDSIEDSLFNTTHFAVIQKKSKAPKTVHAKKTSVAFHFKEDSPSSLYSILKCFADERINLTKIESRPSATVSGQYVFYLDFDGGVESPHIKTALTRVRKQVARLKILGSY